MDGAITAGRSGRPLFWAALPLFAAMAALGVVAYGEHEPERLAAVYWLLSGATFLVWAGLSLLALWRRSTDRRVRVFALTAVAVSLTLSMPTIDVRWPGWILVLSLALASLAYFGIVPVIVHMASEIPGDNPFISAHPRFIRANYAGGALLVAIGFAVWTAAVFDTRDVARLRWLDSLVLLLNRASLVYAGLAAIYLLVRAARVESRAHRRRQAFIVLCAMILWTLNPLVLLAVPTLPERAVYTNVIEPLIVMVPALALAVAIFGFHLLDIGGALRKGAVTGVLIAGLVLIFYVTLDAAAGPVARMLGPAGIPALATVALIGAALLFDPLSRKVSAGVDRVFFPEKALLRRLQRSLLNDMAGETTIDALGARLVQTLVDDLGAASAVLLVADDEGGLFRVRAMAGRTPAGERTRMAVVRDGAGIPPELACETAVRVNFRERPLALICLGPLESGARLDADDRDALSHVAQQLSAMIENARLFELARTDSLTGLARRHVFEEALEQEHRRSQRTRRPFAVAMIDVDHFKRINDQHGHRAGDLVLQEIARVLAANCRTLDLLARYGGEEFAMLLPETDRAAAAVAAEKLRAAVNRAAVESNGMRLAVSISVGVADSTSGGTGDIVARADEALYAAKRAGRNQVQ